jgi:hypothetical protein
LAELNLSSESEDNYSGASNQPPPTDVLSRRKQWEAGNIDYMGGDAYENIEKKLDESMAPSEK